MKRAAVALALALAACDGGGNANDTSVVAVRVSPANPSLQVDATIAFVATAFQVNGEQRPVTEDVTWATSAASIVSIDADGVATGEAPGEAYVTATLGDLSSPSQKIVVTPGPTPTPTPVVANHVVISEVHFNPNTAQGGEPAGQFVELYNPTGSPVDLTNWSVAYNNTAGTAFVFTAPFTLVAGAYVVLANTPGSFDGDPYPTVANIFPYSMPNLSNTGDWFTLTNAGGVKVDEMAYGTGFSSTKPAGWCGSQSPTATDGTAVGRKPVNIDTDTCADWQSNTTPTPGTATP